MNKSELKEKIKKAILIKKKIENAKKLYQEYDSLMEEILPNFIKNEKGRVLIDTEIKIGNETFKLIPAFYDQIIKSKNWKSVAFNNFEIGE